MNYSDLISGMTRFGVSNEEICINSLGVTSEKIQENVIISPGWDPEIMPNLGKIELLNSRGPLYGVQIWNIKNEDIEMTYIKTGCGAPVLMDTLLALGLSKCKRILFISSVGSLSKEINIGDIVLPEYSVCGDGASRYIASDEFGQDVFGEKVFPDFSLFKLLKLETENICNKNQVKWHIGYAFCTDTIFAQFPHINNMLSMGCNLIDMETAAAFRAAKMIKKPLVALFCVSDNSILNKSLISKRTQKEVDYRKFVRSEIVLKIILNLIKADIR